MHSLDEFKDVVFPQLPDSYAILDRDFVSASTVIDAFVRGAHVKTAGELLGRNIFDVFPGNPADPDDTGPERLRASLQQVSSTRGLPHARGPAPTTPSMRQGDGQPIRCQHIPLGHPLGIPGRSPWFTASSSPGGSGLFRSPPSAGSTLKGFPSW